MTSDQYDEESELPPAGNPAEASNKDVPPSIATFVEKFYKISDTPDVHEQYADDYFIHDEDRLSFQIGPMQPTNKREGIVAWRRKGWEGVTRRKHVVNGVFISPKWENEIMLDGSVEMDKNGSTLKFNWAGRMVFDHKSLEEGAPKIETYKVWLVSDRRAHASIARSLGLDIGCGGAFLSMVAMINSVSFLFAAMYNASLPYMLLRVDCALQSQE